MADLLAATTAELGRLHFNQIYQDIQHYEVMSQWLKKDKVKIKGGPSVNRNVMIQDGESSASHVGLLDEDDVSIRDLMRTVNVKWVHAQTKWAVIYQTDILMNSGKELIYDVVKPRRAAAIIDMAALLEAGAWDAVPAATTTTEPYGVQYWVVKDATGGATGGFYGGNPSGYSDVGGIDPTVDTRWKNWSATYSTQVTKTGAIKSMRSCKRQTNFVSPVDVPDYRKGMGQKYRVYCNETTLQEFEDIGEGQNESLGRDIASMDGKMVFYGNPIRWVPQLDSATDNPIYMLDHGCFYPICLKGDYLREGDATQAPHQHNVFQTFVDLSYNFLCDNRRSNGVVYKV